MKLQIGSVFLATMFGLSTTAGAAVIDFQSLEVADGGTHDIGSSYSEDGFTISQPGAQPHPLAVFGTLESRYAGSTGLFNNTVSGLIRLTWSGGPFSAFSIDLANLNGQGNVTTTFVGTRSDSSTVTQSFTFDSFQSFTTFGFDDEFMDLVRLDWTQDSPFHQFDNIVVNQDGSVPEPAGLTLLAAGIGLLVRSRRRAARQV